MVYAMAESKQRREREVKEMIREMIKGHKHLYLLKTLALTVIGASVATFGFTGCGNSKAGSSDTSEISNESSDAAESSAELKEFRIGAGGSDDSPAMELASVAYDKGYLEEELNKVGYTVKVSAFQGGGPEINEALAAGELDAAIYGDFPAFTSKSNGIDTKIIALTNGQQQYAVLAANDEIKTAKDLEGKKVIVQQGTVVQYFYEHYVEARGLDADKIEIINSGDAMSLLQSGDADAYIMQQNLLYYYESLGVGKVIDTGNDIPEGSPTFVFEVASKLLEEKPEIGVAVNKALIRAYDDVAENPQTLYDAVASEAIPAEFQEKNYEFDKSLKFMSPEITSEKISYYENLNQWMQDHSIISNPVDVQAFIDNSYYKKAFDELKK